MTDVFDRSAMPATRRAQIHRGRAGPPAAPEPGRVDLEPGSAYEVVTRQMVEAVAEDLDEIKGRLNGLLWMVAGAIVIDLVVRLTGTG